MKQSSINWNEIKSKLARAEEALVASLSFTEERREALLRQRAKYLATRNTRVRDQAPTVSALVFSLGTERYAITLTELRRVLPLATLIPVPQAPEGLMGVMNIDGEVRSIWHLAKLLNLPNSSPFETNGQQRHVLVIGQNNLAVGLCVDHADERQEIEANLNLPSGENDERYIRGMTADKILFLSAELILKNILKQTKEESEL